MSQSWSDAEVSAQARPGFLESIFDNMDDAVLVTEAHPADGPGPRIVYVSEAFIRMTGYTYDETVGKTPQILRGEKTDLGRLGEIRDALSRRKPVRVELPNYRKDGTEFRTELDISPVTDECGNPTHFVWTQRDITGRQQEHKRAGEWPEKGKQHSHSLIQHNPDIITVIEADGNISYESPSVERVLGYRPEELVGTNAFAYVHPEDTGLVRHLLGRVLKRRSTSSRLEYRFRHADGSWRRLEAVASDLTDEPGVRGIVVSSRDVGRHKWVEEALKAGHELLGMVMESTTDAVFVKNLEGRYLLINRAGAEALGKSVEEVIGKNDVELFSDRDGRKIVEWDRETLASGETHTTEDTKTTADGKRRTYLVTKGPYRDSKGNVAGLFGISRDITGRKRVEEELRDSEVRYRSLVELSPNAVVVHSDGEILYINTSGAELYGAAGPEELIGRKTLDFVHPDHREVVEARISRCLEKGEPTLPLEQKHVRLDGSIIDVEAAVAPVSYGGKPALQVILRDITGRKRTEAALRKSEKQLRNLIRHGWDIVSILEPDGTIRYESPAIKRVLGYRPEEVVGTNAHDYVHPDDAEMVANRYSEGLANGGSDMPIEARFLCSDGSWKYLEAVAVFLADDPDVEGVIINSRDITERKEAEEALRGSEARFRSLVRNTPGILAVLDTRGNTRYLLNPPDEQVLGFTGEERLGMNVFDDIVHPDERGRARALLQETLSKPGHTTSPTMFRTRTGDGSWRWLTVVCTNLLEDPSIRGIMVNAWDITEQKEAEEALKESERRFRQLFEQSVDILVVHDGDGRIFDCNQATCCALGYSRQEMLSLTIRDLDPNVLSEEERRDREASGGTLWQRVLADDQSTQAAVVRTTLRRKDGTTFPAEVRVGGVDYGGERMILASTRDVSERRRLEERLAHQATHDPLTDLPNRRLFMDHLERALEHAGRRKSKVAVMFMDLDNFKQANDALGHEAGDRLLVAVARRLRGRLRSVDTAARLGGDEFVVVFEGVSGEVEAARTAERIQEALNSPFELDGRKISLTTSAGVALGEPGPDAGPRAEDLLKEADAAMYRAKKEGGGRHKISLETNGGHPDGGETP